jgi:putative PIN family toxin of toxin-antitoxin system
VLVSFLIGKRLKGFLALLASSGAQIVVSIELLDELAEVLGRPHLRRYFTVEEAKEFVVLFEHLGKPVAIDLSERSSLSRDPKDDYLLRMAEKAKADVLVTGDTDLLILERHKDTVILSVKDFTASYLK